MEVFAKRLKAVRQANNISQQLVADFCGVSQSVIGQYERGACTPTTRTIKTLAAFYNVSIDYLMGISDEPKNLNR